MHNQWLLFTKSRIEIRLDRIPPYVFLSPTTDSKTALIAYTLNKTPIPIPHFFTGRKLRPPVIGIEASVSL